MGLWIWSAPMTFYSDNTAPATPEVMAALNAANAGFAAPYGDDTATQSLNAAFSRLFETDVAVFPVPLGTAANGLLLSCLTRPWGVILANGAAHVLEDESTAPELFTDGARLVGLPGDRAKLDAATLRQRLVDWPWDFIHTAKPQALALTQSTEQGTVYTPDEVAALCDAAKAHGLKTMMDGARFANAVAHLGCAPADLTWRAGIDAMVFGVTKNGGMAAEAAVLFDRSLAEEFALRQKRAGQLISKMRYLSVQIAASIADDMWLKRAAHANAMATRLAAGLQAVPGVKLCHQPQANAVFVRMAPALADALSAAGWGFNPWRSLGQDSYRLVTAWDTPAETVDGFLAAVRDQAAA